MSPDPTNTSALTTGRAALCCRRTPCGRRFRHSCTTPLMHWNPNTCWTATAAPATRTTFCCGRCSRTRPTTGHTTLTSARRQRWLVGRAARGLAPTLFVNMALQPWIPPAVIAAVAVFASGCGTQRATGSTPLTSGATPDPYVSVIPAPTATDTSGLRSIVTVGPIPSPAPAKGAACHREGARGSDASGNTCSTTTWPGNCCRWSWGSAPDRPPGGVWTGGSRPESSTGCTAILLAELNAAGEPCRCASGDHRLGPKAASVGSGDSDSAS